GQMHFTVAQKWRSMRDCHRRTATPRCSRAVVGVRTAWGEPSAHFPTPAKLRGHEPFPGAMILGLSLTALSRALTRPSLRKLGHCLKNWRKPSCARSRCRSINGSVLPVTTVTGDDRLTGRRGSLVGHEALAWCHPDGLRTQRRVVFSVLGC